MAVEYVDTRQVPLDELSHFPGNAKHGDVVRIRQSIARNGQYRSLVVREVENGPLIVLAGNHTMMALKAEGHVTARCEILRCDDHTARRINLADNRLAELGGYDDDALVELLSYLDGDLDGTGYTDDDIRRLIEPPALPDEGDAPIDDVEAVWGVIVTCRNEVQQSDLLARLDAEGYAVRAMLA